MGIGNTQQAQNESAEPVAQQGGSDVAQRVLIGVLVLAVVCLLFGGLLSSITGNLAEIERQRTAQDQAYYAYLATLVGIAAASGTLQAVVMVLAILGSVAFFLFALRLYTR